MATLGNFTYNMTGTIAATAFQSTTGTGNTVVLSTSPTLVTPTLGVASITSVNKVAITAPATSATLTIADGKTLTANASLTLAGTDAKTLTVSNSLTLAGTDATTITFPSTSTSVFASSYGHTISGPTAARTYTLPDASVSLGYLNIPQNSQSVDYTLDLPDSGYHILETGASKTVTIPANGTKAFALGTAVLILAGANSVTIAITTDTLRWAQDGTTGSRTLAAYGQAMIVKTGTTEWRISGTGLT